MIQAGDMPSVQPRFLDAGEAALVVEFGDRIDPVLNDRVLALDDALARQPVAGVLECVPTFRSLMIHYEPLVISRDDLVALVQARDIGGSALRKPAHRWHMPVCYEPPFGEDLAEVAAGLALSEAVVVRLHASAIYRLYMYGFAPGFAYLGGLPEALGIPRRASPRAPHPDNAVMMAGGMSLITTFSMPTGWWVIGRTPERMFLPGREPAFLMAVGDEIRFEPVDGATFTGLDARAASGETVARRDVLP
jgi:inhibitor of KinA